MYTEQELQEKIREKQLVSYWAGVGTGVVGTLMFCFCSLWLAGAFAYLD